MRREVNLVKWRTLKAAVRSHGREQVYHDGMSVDGVDKSH